MRVVIVEEIVARDVDGLKPTGDFHPVDVPAVASGDVQDDRGDTADTTASTRHSEDVHTWTEEFKCYMDLQYPTINWDFYIKISVSITPWIYL